MIVHSRGSFSKGDKELAAIPPKTLAKTLTYILVTAPGEFGLFWNPDGTMPWKELYWALQEDEALRFVRESHVREIRYLGIELPFDLDGSVLRWKASRALPPYPLELHLLPRRLYFACRPRQLPRIRENGLEAGARPYLPLTADRQAALRIGRRRDPESVVLEIITDEAARAHVPIYRADHGLYLANSIPARFIHFPLLRREDGTEAVTGKKKKTGKVSAGLSATPGSYLLSPRDLGTAGGNFDREPKQPQKKGKGKSGWKRSLGRERQKRTP